MRSKFKAINILIIITALMMTMLLLISCNDKQETYNIPILLYHHLSDDVEESGTVLSTSKFEHQISMLKANGYTAVTFDDIIAFVEEGKALPQKAVIITFDDGYTSNYEYGYPILKKYGFKATIFAIGSSIGKAKYKDTDYDMYPHFGKSEIEEMEESGVIDIQSHTFDMHQWAPYETGDYIRENMLPLNNESEEEYRATVKADVAMQDKTFADCNLPKSYILAFPRGEYTNLTSDILVSCGYKVTVTTMDQNINTIKVNDSSSLINLGRMNISSTTTDQMILDYCAME